MWYTIARYIFFNLEYKDYIIYILFISWFISKLKIQSLPSQQHCGNASPRSKFCFQTFGILEGAPSDQNLEDIHPIQKRHSSNWSSKWGWWGGWKTWVHESLSWVGFGGFGLRFFCFLFKLENRLGWSTKHTFCLNKAYLTISWVEDWIWIAHGEWGFNMFWWA